MINLWNKNLFPIQQIVSAREVCYNLKFECAPRNDG